MFRPTDPQLSLLESRFLVGPKKRERLERSWAEAFRTKILPLIDEEAFRACFHEDNGRPNKSIRLSPDRGRSCRKKQRPGGRSG